MYGHRVSVEVGVVRRTHQWVHLYCVTFDKYWAECLDRLAVKGRCAVQEHVLILYRLFEDWPHFRRFILNEASGSANVVGELAREKPLNDERAEELQDHVLRQTALVERQVWPDDDDGAARVVYALTEKVLAKIPVLAFEVIGERFKRATAASQDA